MNIVNFTFHQLHRLFYWFTCYTKKTNVEK